MLYNDIVASTAFISSHFAAPKERVAITVHNAPNDHGAGVVLGNDIFNANPTTATIETEAQNRTLKLENEFLRDKIQLLEGELQHAKKVIEHLIAQQNTLRALNYEPQNDHNNHPEN